MHQNYFVVVKFTKYFNFWFYKFSNIIYISFSQRGAKIRKGAKGGGAKICIGTKGG